MSENGLLTYAADYGVPLGETLLETLETLGITQADLAERTGRPLKTINEIIKGKTRITPDTALQLERVLGVPAGFWNNRERLYREALARQLEREELRAQASWLKELPVSAMVKLRWVEKLDDKAEQVREVLRFFGVASRHQWKAIWAQERVHFRKSCAFQSDLGSLAAWLRKGELVAQQIRCGPYNEGKFRSTLRQVRGLTVEDPSVFVRRLVESCASCGVAVVFVAELPRTRASGATRWLTPEKALIQLSLRYKTDDHLWFTFFHEAGHIVLHGKRVIFLEKATGRGKIGHEQAANRFAEEILIPKREFDQFLASGQFAEQAIAQFASDLGIAPGIVVGRLQHHGFLRYDQCNGMKRRFIWANGNRA